MAKKGIINLRWCKDITNSIKGVSNYHDINNDNERGLFFNDSKYFK